MAVFQQVPTFRLPLQIDPASGTATFDEHWLNWFLSIAAAFNGSGPFQHNNLQGIQGGDPAGDFHLTLTQATRLLTNIEAFDSTTVGDYHSHRGMGGMDFKGFIPGGSPVDVNFNDFRALNPELPASVFQYLIVQGGTVTSITYHNAAASFITIPPTQGLLPLYAGDHYHIVYTVAPTIHWTLI
jgi:hypothetical protein